ncbi:MAG: phospholipid carrier-dependent glycosyltransferase, partial [bacterium]|nr:phospholipid carrier-dependent glycosyltransferase [bacterium]
MLKEFYEKHRNALFVISVVIVTYFLYFHNLGNFKLLDVDETRYVDMSRYMRETGDYMTLFLNGEYFFEKPPLYFWLENVSFAIFNAVNEFTARVPGCVEGILTALVLFFTTKKFTKNTKLATISALVLLCSAEFLILSKTAILDILLGAMVSISVLCGFMTFSAEEKQKKFYWWGFYLFSALGVLGKGIPAIAVPFGIMFVAGLYTKKLKEYFKPQYFLVGLLMFFAVVIPWHKLMLSMYDPLFFDEYIIKHHIARFLGSDVIHRERPLLYFIPVILWGTLPFAHSFIALIVEKLSKLKNFKGFKNISIPKFEEMNEESKFLSLCLIGAIVTLLFFSSSGTKLITYIIPIYPYLAVIIAKYWLEYIENCDHKKGVEISSEIFNYLLIVAGIGFAVAINFLPEPIKGDLQTIALPVIFTVVVFPVLGLVAIKKDNRKL